MLENITFDNFMHLDSKTRKFIINDIESLKVLVSKNLNEKRFAHTLSVADVCYNLAKKHHVDPTKAYVAGLLHDVCKYLSKEEYESYLKHYDPDILEYPIGTYHGFVAKYYLKEKMNFHDSEILNAIYNHTLPKSKDKLTRILYIADKREPLRKIDDNILDLAFIDLNKAYQLLVIEVEEYLKGNNEEFIGNRL